MNTMGRIFRVSLLGESHGEGVGALLDGVTAGLPLKAGDFARDLGRRRSGAAGTTPRREKDLPVFRSRCVRRPGYGRASSHLDRKPGRPVRGL